MCNNGTVVKFNSRLNFDGSDDYVGIPDNSKLDPTAKLSVSAWVLPDSGYESGNRSIVAKASGTAFGSRQYLLGTDVTTGYPRFAVYDTGVNKATGTAILSSSTWTHLVGVYDGANVLLYVNGRLVNST